ncbi:hypothetical protein M409DRAFT_22192 [Zasmidium cellare ATCC 36951]|uniref:Uncharacterized protein n=1 Tax=Zasmidium cellare ATCC 36951 TaxID=1080233 RepID=A0A6A6CK17_ZASCE|nr:uncharacterized protein M409DRAFT_22192 [Zasmidium cellare ATCC 36951]KAF2167381.1 hypothetical protein M409DRAFT_22192 [Zasmidium cellare ATCC 36951]
MKSGLPHFELPAFSFPGYWTIVLGLQDTVERRERHQIDLMSCKTLLLSIEPTLRRASFPRAGNSRPYITPAFSIQTLNDISKMDENKRRARECLTRARKTLLESEESVFVRKVEAAMKRIFDITPLMRANNTTSTTTTTTTAEIPNSTNQQALRCMLQAWDYFELVDDYTSADLVKALAEEIFGGDAWGSAIQAYVEEDAITKHQGEVD